MIGFPLDFTFCNFLRGKSSCIFGGDSDISWVLNHPPDIKVSNISKNTKAVEELLSRGADATQRDHEGNLPFFTASASGSLSEAFLMVRAVSSQGLFEQMRRAKNVRLHAAVNHRPVKRARRSKRTRV
jgi:hypothetical protein